MLLGQSVHHPGHLRKETQIHIQKVKREGKAELSEPPSASAGWVHITLHHKPLINENGAYALLFAILWDVESLNEFVSGVISGFLHLVTFSEVFEKSVYRLGLLPTWTPKLTQQDV